MPSWLKVEVERAGVDPTSIRVERIQQFSKWLNTFDFAELSEARKEKSIAATNVKNASPPLGRTKASQRFDNELRTRAPPPMFIVQIAISFGVFRIQTVIQCAKAN